jgi:hypothetical protein
MGLKTKYLKVFKFRNKIMLHYMENENLEKPVKVRKKRAPNKGESYKSKYYKAFGRLIINTQYLNEMEVPYILIKHNSDQTTRLSPVPLLRRTKISEQFRKILNHYLETNEISKTLQKELSDKEQEILQTACYVAKIPFEWRSKSVDDYVIQFNILKEKLVSGDNSVKDELKEILILLSNPVIKKISKEDCDEFLELIDEM